VNIRLDFKDRQDKHSSLLYGSISDKVIKVFTFDNRIKANAGDENACKRCGGLVSMSLNFFLPSSLTKRAKENTAYVPGARTIKLPTTVIYGFSY
jgi:hypothetical protein